jgi:tRNA-uridine 2-sulfurtransferase
MNEANTDTINYEDLSFNSFICNDSINRVFPETCELAVIAMSGGVDSSVAAVAIKQAGIPAMGVSMQVWDYRRDTNEKNSVKNASSCTKASCCAPSDFNDARSVATQLDIPYYVFDMEDIFQEKVINKFVDAYHNGYTPNPCVECNNKVKFYELRKRGKALGCSHVVTGHYARIVKGAKEWELHRALDDSKDQSYFLYGLLREELEETIFPLGHLQKSVVRSIAKEHGLSTASKPESQDICFVSGSVQEFITKVGRQPTQHGTLITSDGVVLGEHTGVHNFTVGQRRGLRLGGNEQPLYVVNINSETAQVTVGPKSELERDFFAVHSMNWLLKSIPRGSFEAIAQVRSRHRGTKVLVDVDSNDQTKIHVRFLSEWAPISPGQAAVLYDLDNSRVLGGGVISGNQL